MKSRYSKLFAITLALGIGTSLIPSHPLAAEIEDNKIILAQNTEEETRIQVYQKASPAVVFIQTTVGLGSGFTAVCI